MLQMKRSNKTQSSIFEVVRTFTPKEMKKKERDDITQPKLPC